MQCLQCGKRLPLLKRWRHSGFCSEAHRQAYQDVSERAALERLVEAGENFQAIRDCAEVLSLREDLPPPADADGDADDPCLALLSLRDPEPEAEAAGEAEPVPDSASAPDPLPASEAVSVAALLERLGEAQGDPSAMARQAPRVLSAGIQRGRGLKQIAGFVEGRPPGAYDIYLRRGIEPAEATSGGVDGPRIPAGPSIQIEEAATRPDQDPPRAEPVPWPPAAAVNPPSRLRGAQLRDAAPSARPALPNGPQGDFSGAAVPAAPGSAIRHEEAPTPARPAHSRSAPAISVRVRPSSPRLASAATAQKPATPALAVRPEAGEVEPPRAAAVPIPFQLCDRRARPRSAGGLRVYFPKPRMALPQVPVPVPPPAADPDRVPAMAGSVALGFGLPEPRQTPRATAGSFAVADPGVAPRIPHWEHQEQEDTRGPRQLPAAGRLAIVWAAEPRDGGAALPRLAASAAQAADLLATGSLVRRPRGAELTLAQSGPAERETHELLRAEAIALPIEAVVTESTVLRRATGRVLPGVMAIRTELLAGKVKPDFSEAPAQRHTGDPAWAPAVAIPFNALDFLQESGGMDAQRLWAADAGSLRIEFAAAIPAHVVRPAEGLDMAGPLTLAPPAAAGAEAASRHVRSGPLWGGAFGQPRIPRPADKAGGAIRLASRAHLRVGVSDSLEPWAAPFGIGTVEIPALEPGGGEVESSAGRSPLLPAAAVALLDIPAPDPAGQLAIEVFAMLGDATPRGLAGEGPLASASGAVLAYPKPETTAGPGGGAPRLPLGIGGPVRLDVGQPGGRIRVRRPAQAPMGLEGTLRLPVTEARLSAAIAEARTLLPLPPQELSRCTTKVLSCSTDERAEDSLGSLITVPDAALTVAGVISGTRMLPLSAGPPLAGDRKPLGKAECSWSEKPPILREWAGGLATAPGARPGRARVLNSPALGRFWRSAPADLKWISMLVPIFLIGLVYSTLPTPKASAESGELSAAGLAGGARKAPGRFGTVGELVSREVGRIQKTLSARAGVEFIDDFRSGLSDWQGRPDWARSWSYDAAGLVRAGQLALYRPSVKLADYNMQFMAQIEKHALSWVVRARDLENYYVVKLVVTRPGPMPTVSVVRYPVVGGREGAHIQTPLPLTVRNDTIYRVGMVLQGSQYTLTVQGQVADSWSDQRFLTGGVGFFNGRGDQALLRWVQVSYQYDAVGRLCAYLAPYQLEESGSWKQ
jgi:hypothetical protein